MKSVQTVLEPTGNTSLLSHMPRMSCPSPTPHEPVGHPPELEMDMGRLKPIRASASPDCYNLRQLDDYWARVEREGRSAKNREQKRYR